MHHLLSKPFLATPARGVWLLLAQHAIIYCPLCMCLFVLEFRASVCLHKMVTANVELMLQIYASRIRSLVWLWALALLQANPVYKQMQNRSQNRTKFCPIWLRILEYSGWDVKQNFEQRCPYFNQCNSATKQGKMGIFPILTESFSSAIKPINRVLASYRSLLSESITDLVK